MGCLGGTRESVISLGLGWMIVCIPLLMIKFRLVVHIILSLFFIVISHTKAQLMMEFHTYFLDHV